MTLMSGHMPLPGCKRRGAAIQGGGGGGGGGHGACHTEIRTSGTAKTKKWTNL